MLQRRYRKKKTLGGVAGRQTTKPSKKCQAGNFIIPRETQAYAAGVTGNMIVCMWISSACVLALRTLLLVRFVSAKTLLGAESEQPCAPCHHSRLRAMVGEPEPQRTNNQAAVRRRETASTRLGFLPVAIGCGRPVTQLSATGSLFKVAGTGSRSGRTGNCRLDGLPCACPRPPSAGAMPCQGHLIRPR
jgi:hypothetical protein